MGDLPDGDAGPPHPAQQAQQALLQSAPQEDALKPASGVSGVTSSTPAFYTQYSSLDQQQHQQLQRFSSQPASPYQQPYQPTTSPFGMAGLVSALPNYHSPAQHSVTAQQSDQQRLSGASTPALVYQIQQNLQMQNYQYMSSQGSSMYSDPAAAAYGMQYPPQLQQMNIQSQSMPNALYASPDQRMPHHVAPQQFYQHGYSSQRSPVPPQYMSYQHHQPPYMPNTAFGGPPHGPYPRQRHHVSRDFPPKPHQSFRSVEPGQRSGQETIVSSSTSSLASLVPVPRGPPRKPKQSGHALWVGNLPPNAGIIALKDHFSLDAKDDIESVFLISKSNCAFVNYRTAEACHAAQIRFHESKFAGSKLVCRLRKRQEPKEWPQGPRARYGPGDWPTSRRSSSGMSAEPDERVPVLAGVGERGWDGVVGSTAGKDTFSSPGPPAGRTRDRYFVVKSLTQLDLEQSVRNGIWTTQSHNEAALNKAFESSEDVYLIFSVNKSGEYFGYARMASSISDDSEIHQEILSATTLADHPLPDIVGDPPPPQLKAPSAPAASMPTLDPPKMIPTPATDTAPPGRVIDDSARGTIFWEAGSVDGENTAATESDGVDGISPSKADYSTLESSPQPLPQIYGKPFRVQWLSTTRVPYWRMRGLRNPWNSNREVKIARDGTELETTCGRKLLEFFKSPENIDGVVLAAQR